MTYKILKKHKSFEGDTLFCEHYSQATKTNMKFSLFLPTNIENIESALIWLSGLTCNEENFITKAGIQNHLAGSKTMIICPDTSPRGLNLPGEEDSYDFGTGAGFYVNATTENYAQNYHMYDYIVKDLVELLEIDFAVKKYSVFGHSMGGHGALIIGLRENSKFKSISAFSPIVNPVACAWGKKALNGYLGEDKKTWSEYDACELIKSGIKHPAPIFISQGIADEFYPDQLLTKNFEEICKKENQKLKINYCEGYDHSYYYISTFLNSHIEFHQK
jgi:S-formylglutathione hydrolase